MLTFVTAAMTFYLVDRVSGPFAIDTRWEPLWAVARPVVAALASVFAAGLLWLSPWTSGGPTRAIGTGALILGAVGLSVGFLGALILRPEWNQGPLFGVFVTGPTGFALGGVLGAGYWAIRRSVALVRRLREPARTTAEGWLH